MKSKFLRITALALCAALSTPSSAYASSTPSVNISQSSIELHGAENDSDTVEAANMVAKSSECAYPNLAKHSHAERIGPNIRLTVPAEIVYGKNYTATVSKASGVPWDAVSVSVTSGNEYLSVARGAKNNEWIVTPKKAGTAIVRVYAKCCNNGKSGNNRVYYYGFYREYEVKVVRGERIYSHTQAQLTSSPIYLSRSKNSVALGGITIKSGSKVAPKYTVSGNFTISGNYLIANGAGTGYLFVGFPEDEQYNSVMFTVPINAQRGSDNLGAYVNALNGTVGKSWPCNTKSAAGLPVSVAITDTSVAAFENGRIVAKKAGSTKAVLSTAGDAWHAPVSKIMSITVEPKRTPTLDVIGAYYFKVGMSEQLQFSTNSDGELSFKSLTPDIASVDSNGVLTSLKSGHAQLEVTVAETAEYNKCESVFTVTVRKGDPKLNVTTPTNKKIGDPDFTLEYSQAGDGAPAFVSNTESVVEVGKNGEVRIKGSGDASITVSVPTTEKYETASKTVNFTVAQKESTFAFDTESINKKFGDEDFTLGHNGTGVQFSSSNASVATVDSSGRVHIKGVGTAVITGTVPASVNIKAGKDHVTITVGKGSPTLSVTTPSDKKFGDSDFKLSVSENSDASPTYSSTGPISVSENGIVTINGAGEARVTVTLAETDKYLGATKTINFSIDKCKPVFHFTSSSVSLSSGEYDLKQYLQYSGSGAISFTPVSENGISVSEDGIAAVSNGGKSVTVEASIAGDSNYEPATASITITAKQVKPDFKITSPGSKKYGDAAFTLGFTENSDGVLSFESSNQSVATVNDSGRVTITGVGTTTITGYLTETDSFTAAEYSVTLTVGKNSGSLSIASPANELSIGDSFQLQYYSSGGTPTFSSNNQSVATVSGDTVTIKGYGTVTITGSIPATSTSFGASSSVTFTVVDEEKYGRVDGSSAPGGTFHLKKYNDGTAPIVDLGKLQNEYGSSLASTAVMIREGAFSGSNLTGVIVTDICTIEHGAFSNSNLEWVYLPGVGSFCNVFVNPGALDGLPTDTVIFVEDDGLAQELSNEYGSNITVVNVNDPGDYSGKWFVINQNNTTYSNGDILVLLPEVSSYSIPTGYHGSIYVMNGACAEENSLQTHLESDLALWLDWIRFDGPSEALIGFDEYKYVKQLNMIIGNKEDIHYEQVKDSFYNDTVFVSINPTNEELCLDMSSVSYTGEPIKLSASDEIYLQGYSGNGHITNVLSTPTVKGVNAGVGTVTLVTDFPFNQTTVVKEFTIHKATPSVSFTQPDAKVFGDSDFTLDFSENSEADPIFESSNHSVATVNGEGVVTINGAGTTTITMTLPESANYLGASKSVELVVEKAFGTANFTENSLSGVYSVDGIEFNITDKLETSISDGTVVLKKQSGDLDVTVVEDGSVVAYGVGSAVIEATVTGSSVYNDASATITINVTKASQMVTVTEPEEVVFGCEPFALQYSAAENSLVSFDSSNKEVATIDQNGIITVTGAGTTTITVTANETDFYKEASNSVTLTVGKAGASVVLPTDVVLTIGDEYFIELDDSFGYDWQFSSSSDGITIDGNTVTAVSAGDATISVSADATENYKAFTGSFSVTVEHVPAKITKQPESVVTKLSMPVNFEVKAEGTNNQYQWYSSTSGLTDGTAIVGATSSVYSIPAGSVTSTLDGKYFYCVVTDGKRVLVTDVVKLTIESKPTRPIFTPALQNTSWTKGELTISLNGSTIAGSEDGVGYQYSMDGGTTWNEYENAIVWNEDTKSARILARAYNTADKSIVSDTSAVLFKYDASAPVVKSVDVIDYKVSVNAEDVTSGIKSFTLQTKDGASIGTVDSAQIIVVHNAGEYRVVVEDNAGNTSVSEVFSVEQNPETCEHSFVLDESTVVEADCVHTGFSGNEECSTCGEMKDGETIPATGAHIFPEHYITVKEPTTTEEGIKRRECIICGEPTDETTIPVLPEEEIEGDDSLIDPTVCEHQYGAESVNRIESSCVSTGLVLYSKECSLCGDIQERTENLELSEHQFSKYFQIIKEASETEDGLKAKLCLICEEPSEETVIPKYGTIVDPETPEEDKTLEEIREEIIKLFSLISEKNSEDYTEDSWNNLQQVSDNTIEIFNDQDATREDLLQALQDLDEAIKALVLVTPENPDDNNDLEAIKEELKKLVDSVNSKDSNDYTEESWNNLQEVLSSVNSIFNNPDATREDLLQALQDLDEAIEGLVLVTETPEKPYNPNDNLNEDTDGDGIPDTNIDNNKDGKADTNIDNDGDGKADTNIDTNSDGIADTNLDDNADGIPDRNIDNDGDDKPDDAIDANRDGKVDEEGEVVLGDTVNVDVNGDGIADLNVDVNGDGKPDLNVDVDGDGKPDLNIDVNGDGNPDLNVDVNKDWVADLFIDVNGDFIADTNLDTNNDGIPDEGVDANRDGKVDLEDVPLNQNNANVDTNEDGLADLNVDTDGDGKPDNNLDTNSAGKPDLNVDVDADGRADLNVDTDGDGKADLNVDSDGDGIADTNVDTDGDGVADKNADKVQTPGEGTAPEKPDDLEAIKEELKTLIDSINGKDSKDYTEDSWNKLQEVLSSVNSILNNPESTKESIEQALKDLEEALKGLVLVPPEKPEKPDDLASLKEELKTLIDSISSKNQNDYTDDSWNKLQEVLSSVNSILNNPESTKEAIEKALKDLEEALKGLVLVPSEKPEKPDDLASLKEELKTLIDSVNGKDSKDYTKESWNKLQEVLSSVNSILNNPESTKESIEQALKDLEKALKGLVTATSTTPGAQGTPSKPNPDSTNGSNDTNTVTVLKDGSISVIKENKISEEVLKLLKVDFGTAKAYYTGKPVTIPVKVVDNQGRSVDTKEYTVFYSNNNRIGTASVKVIFNDAAKSTISGTFSITAKKGSKFTVGKFKYKVTGASTVSVIGMKNKTAKKATIAKTVKIGGKKFKITQIGNNAFKGYKKLKKVTIGKNVTKIGKKAFFNSKKLKTITIKSAKLKSVGKNAFKKTHKLLKVKTPKAKLKAYKKLLKGKGMSAKSKVTK